ncbi:MAG: zinc/iron-chelating domain-containing protein [Thalassobius sp.]|nr:zinc/iron-chelating domain-containing protein [Thalassovita sp.]
MKETSEQWYKEWQAKKSSVKKQNKKFINKLAQHKGKRLDVFADEIDERTFKKVDCLQCANCCSSIPPIVNNTDVNRIAKHLGMKPQEFEDTYLMIDEDQDKVMKTTPCTFLQEDNMCSIYEVRPKACREYPHTGSQEFSNNLHLHAPNAFYCPAVFHILEEMKKNIPV